jgi:hypothetical protein
MAAGGVVSEPARGATERAGAVVAAAVVVRALPPSAFSALRYACDSSAGLAARIRAGVQYASTAWAAVALPPKLARPAAHASVLTGGAPWTLSAAAAVAAGSVAPAVAGLARASTGRTASVAIAVNAARRVSIAKSFMDISPPQISGVAPAVQPLCTRPGTTPHQRAGTGSGYETTWKFWQSATVRCQVPFASCATRAPPRPRNRPGYALKWSMRWAPSRLRTVSPGRS